MGDRRRLWLCGAIAILLLAGCSGDGDDDAARPSAHESTTSGAPATTSRPSTTTTTAPLSAEEQVVADYLAYWAAYDALVVDPDGASGTTDALAAHASGQALESARQAVRALRDQDQSTQLGPAEKHNPYAPSIIDAQTAYVADCHVAESRVVGADGAVVRSEPTGGRPESIAANLVRSGDHWVVDSLDHYDLAPGELCSPDGPTAE